MKKTNPNKLIALIVIISSLSFILSYSFSKVLAAPKSEKAIEASSKGKDTKQNTEENEEQETASSHRSVVATFVQSILSVADREGGIGEQVRVIAQQQNDALEETTEKIKGIENRNKIKTFLFGSDYKNLGALRSEMVKTRNRIEQLKRLVERTTVEEDKTTLQTQIQALELEQTKITDFITTNESKISLFGWLLKLLNK